MNRKSGRRLIGHHRSGIEGFSLVIALIFISALALISVAVFSMSRLDNTVSSATYQNSRGDFAARNIALLNGFEESVFAHSNNSDDYIVFRSEDPSGATYFYTAQFDDGLNTWVYNPLFSGGKEIEGTATGLQKISLSGNDRLEEGVLTISLGGGGDEIEASDVLRLPAQFGSPTVGWQVMRADPTTLPDDTKLDNFELRYAFWVEDLSGRIDGDFAGNSDGRLDSGDLVVDPEDGYFHIRGFGGKVVEELNENGQLEEMVMPDPGELALFTLMPDDGRLHNLDSEDGDSNPQKGDADNLIQRVRKSEEDGMIEDFVLTLLRQQKQEPLTGYEDVSEMEWNSAIEAASISMSFGTPSWKWGRDLIPKKNWLEEEVHGTPKLALNPLIEKAEKGPAERDEVIRQIAKHIDLCLPEFGTKRTGASEEGLTGFHPMPYTKFEYLHNLAANIVDYADRDLIPSVGSWRIGDPIPTEAETEFEKDLQLMGMSSPDEGMPIVPTSELIWNQDRNTRPGNLTGGSSNSKELGLPDRGTLRRGHDFGDKYPPLYRGIDGQPFFMGVAHQFSYQAPNPQVDEIDITVNTWVSLWNPYDFPLMGDVAVRLTEGWTQVQYGRSPEPDLVLPHLNLGKQNMLIPPNSFFHVKWPEVQPNFWTGVKGKGERPPRRLNVVDRKAGPRYYHIEAGYQLFWNWEPIDEQGSSIDQRVDEFDTLVLADRLRYSDVMNRDFTETMTPTTPAYFASGIGHSSERPEPDPRSSLFFPGAKDKRGTPFKYLPQGQYHNTYLWGGGGIRSSYGDKVQPGEYGDHYHSIDNFNRSPGRNVPDATTTTPPDTEDAPFSVKHPVADYPEGYNGPGYYESLGELGNVFDPGSWEKLKPDEGEISPQLYGGGRTLAIGTKETSRFDQPGIRAIDLLDIFCLENVGKEQKGLVNVNSASKEVLRSLTAGIKMDRDPGVGMDTLFPPSAAKPGDLLAKAITDSRPIANLEDLLQLEFKTSSNNRKERFFGNPNAWSSRNGPADEEWDDAGREELASRILELVTTKSRIFRIYLTAHVVDIFDARGGGTPTEKIVSRKSRIYDVFLEPVFDEDGNFLKQRIKIFYEKDV